MHRKIIKDGKVALPGKDTFSRVDILVRDGKIDTIQAEIDGSPGETLDASDLLVFPGAIDAHVHFNDPGFTRREDFFHGSAAAASGGVTTVIDMPFTSVPPVTSLDNLRRKLDAIEKRAVVDFGIYGGVCSQTFEKALTGGMDELAEEVLGFKVYMRSEARGLGRLNSYQILKVMEKCRLLELPLLVHAEDHDYVQAATIQQRQAGESPREYYLSRPEIAEILAIRTAIELAKASGGNLHIVHIGTAEAAELLRAEPGNAACKIAYRITGETAPHYLAFELPDFEELQGPLKVAPSVKGAGNSVRLWELLREGVLSFVASDHAPAPKKQKYTGSIWTDYAGIPGCGTLLPYMFSEGFSKGRLSLSQLLDVVSGNVARRYGIIGRKGSIEEGKDADFVLIDPDAQIRIDGTASYSKGKVTPFHGYRFDGKIVKTIVRGKIVYDCEEGILAGGGYGRQLRRRENEQ